ncbi:MAG TPA: 4Fe-4S dicluster domain-containing protein [Symbiobacteriaceae bacterium]|jgi:formate dehydrogenase iron-sulfur subunit|nr:4Fe-4S dicluster domain-containing protein [Symbiobacteriaceae bacterium]
MTITRRKLVTRSLALGAGLALAQVPGQFLVKAARAEAPESAQPAGPHPSVLYDLTRCAGCHYCEIACQVNKGLPPEKALLSFRTGTAATGDGQKPWAIRRQQCMHCLNPACVSVCPVAAMYKTAEGPVIYRDERCLGCRYCMNACPFGVPTFDWESGLLDQALIRKCDFCADRQKEGKLPACIEACPTKAVIFGDREALLAEAKERIRQHPEQYVDHIYGETEAGGTSFLMIAGVPFEQLGLPSPGHKALTKLPEKVMGAVVPVALVWAATLSGVTWVVNRRQQLGNHEQAAHSTEKEAKRP